MGSAVGTGTIGGSGRSDVVGVGVREVVELGSGIGGGATTVSCFELFATTKRDHQADDQRAPPPRPPPTAIAVTRASEGLPAVRREGTAAVLPGSVLASAVLPVPYWPVVYGS